MTTALVDAVGDRPLPLAVTATAEHVVVRVNPAARKLVGDVVGRPIRDALPHPALLAALDAAYHRGEPGAVPLPAPDVVVGCLPVADGVLLLLAPADAPPDLRRRTAALHRLAAELAVGGEPARRSPSWSRPPRRGCSRPTRAASSRGPTRGP